MLALLLEQKHRVLNHPLRLVAFLRAVISPRASFNRDFVQTDVLANSHSFAVLNGWMLSVSNIGNRSHGKTNLTSLDGRKHLLQLALIFRSIL
jgi:hypothetical protein